MAINQWHYIPIHLEVFTNFENDKIKNFLCQCYLIIHHVMRGILIPILLMMTIGTQWLHSRIEIDGYEEYSGTEYPSAGCYEEYKIIE